MDSYSFDIEAFKTLGEALAIGMLVGIERYKARSPGEKRSVGVRTCAIFAVMGAVMALVDEVALTVVTFAALAVLLWQGYLKAEKSLGLTTELAALLVFWLGYLMRDFEAPAISAGIVMTVLLAAKRELHDFVSDSVSETEFYDTLKFLVVVFVVYPLLPDRDMGPFEFFNPTQVWTLVILVSTISYVGYLSMRILGHSRGLSLSSLAGGLVSTTAVTVTLAARAKAAPVLSRTCGVLGVAANAVQFPRILVLAWFVDAALGRFLLVPMAGMAVVGLAGAWLFSRAVRTSEPDVEVPLENPYSLTPALKFGLFFVGIFFFVKVADVWLGRQGIYLASGIAGLGDVTAITLSVGELVGGESLSTAAAAAAIFIAITVNAVVKLVLAVVNGSRELAFWLAGGLSMMLGVGYVLAYLSYRAGLN